MLQASTQLSSQEGLGTLVRLASWRVYVLFLHDKQKDDAHAALRVTSRHLAQV